MVFHASTLPFLICYCSFVPCKPLAADQSVCGNTLCVSSFKVDAEKRATCWRDLVDLHSNCWRDSRERIEGWLGGGFKYWSFSSLFGVSWSNLTTAHIFQMGWNSTTNSRVDEGLGIQKSGDLNRSSQVNVELMGSMETQGLFWYACQKSDTQQPGMDTKRSILARNVWDLLTSPELKVMWILCEISEVPRGSDEQEVL